MGDDRLRKDVFRLRPRAPRTSGWLKFFLMIGAFILTGGGQFGHANAEGFPLDAIGRLVVDGSGVCTAFVVRSIPRQVPGGIGEPSVVYENWLVSAGHCLGNDLVFWQRGTAYPVSRILAYSSPGDRGFDAMVGTFTTSLPIPTLQPAFAEYPKPGDKLMLIGYGHNALMMRVGPLLGYDERGHMEIQSYASPGNSGGPVLIPGTRRVVGIGIETTVDLSHVHAQTLCFLGTCPIKPPYVAVHIDRLLGMVSFR